MKKNILFALCLFPLAALAQQTIVGSDTIITKDPTNPNSEYWMLYSPYKKLKAQGKMLNQKKEGVWREYQEYTGLPERAEEFNKGEKEGASMTFGSNGSIATDERYKDGKLEGERITYSTSTRITGIEHYHNGLLDGNKKVYYEDEEKVEEEGDWKNGLREGKTIWFAKTGKPTIEYTYVDGVLDGPATLYNDSGIVSAHGNFLANDEEGKWDYFDAGGKPEKTVIYKQGKIIKETPAKKTTQKKDEAIKK